MSSTIPQNCRYPVDAASSATFALPDGRKIGYAQYGDLSGTPVFYMPGFPSSRIEGAGLEPQASRLRARIIAVDRPGIGWSSPHKSPTLLGHAKDVEALADHLGLTKYGVLGISGGGPYALACARGMPADKLRAVTIVCGLGSHDMTYNGMNITSWLGWTYGQRLAPSLVRWWMTREPGARLDLSEDERMKSIRDAFENGKSSMHAKDVEMFGDHSWMYMHMRRSAEYYVQGTEGFSQDFRLLSSDFGFKIEDIRKDLPVRLWHGRLDNMAPLQHAEKVAARIGDNAHLEITDDTHASIWWNRKEDFLRELVEAVER